MKSVGAALSLALLSASAASSPAALPPGTKTPVEHFIVLMQENHTFDNYFGTYPGADGFPPGTCVPVDPFDPDRSDCVEPFHLGDQAVQDLDHSRRTFRRQYNDGRMDGFIYALDELRQRGDLAMGYYDGGDLPYYWNLADEYVLFDRFFSSAGAGSFLNHLYWVTGSPGDGRDRPTLQGLADMPTIFDRLQAKGISWKFYIQNYDPEVDHRDLVEGAPRPPQVEWVPLLSMRRYLEDPELFSRIVDLEQYFEDLRADSLPAVSYIKVIGASEHPPGSLLAGQRVTRSLIQALMQSPAWPRSAFVITYDDWGGWYDHVAPPQVDDFGYGFRVPALLVSPYARRGFIDSTTLDYTSLLRFIEMNWEVEPLTARDAFANDLTTAFDFSQPPRPPRLIPAVRYTGERAAGPNPILIQGLYLAGVAVSVLLVRRAARKRPRRPEGGDTFSTR